MCLKFSFIILTCARLLKLITSQNMSGHVVGGAYSVIEDFPHVAYLHINCKEVGSTYCGASILNQAILLTAAHCLEKCKESNFAINVYTGNAEKYKGFKSNVLGFKIHEKYIHKNYTNDIALVILRKDLKFERRVKRIVLMKKPPNYKTAVIAGWGWIDDHNTKTKLLKHATQRVTSYETCSKLLPGLPFGTICGSNPNGDHPQRGDSGSALVINKVIEIGLASHFKRKFSNTTLVYTDVPYFFDWIQKTTRELYCKYEYKRNRNIANYVQRNLI